MQFPIIVFREYTLGEDRKKYTTRRLPVDAPVWEHPSNSEITVRSYTKDGADAAVLVVHTGLLQSFIASEVQLTALHREFTKAAIDPLCPYVGIWLDAREAGESEAEWQRRRASYCTALRMSSPVGVVRQVNHFIISSGGLA